MLRAQRAPAGLRLTHRNAGLVDELPQRPGGARVDHAAARHQQRTLGRAEQRRRAGERVGRRRTAVDRPHARLEELLGDRERLDRHILGKRQA